MRTLRSRQLERKKIGRRRRVQIAIGSAHEGMVSLGEKDEQIPEVAASHVAQRTKIFNAGQRVVGFVSHTEVALGDGTADKWAGDFFLNHRSLFIFIK